MLRMVFVQVGAAKAATKDQQDIRDDQKHRCQMIDPRLSSENKRGKRQHRSKGDASQAAVSENSMVYRNPLSTMEKISCPISSVPRRWTRPGGRRAGDEKSSGGNGENMGPKAAARK
ncbi:MAG: hypothetical protein ACLU8D_03910 [Enterocloster sp.]